MAAGRQGVTEALRHVGCRSLQGRSSFTSRLSLRLASSHWPGFSPGCRPREARALRVFARRLSVAASTDSSPSPDPFQLKSICGEQSPPLRPSRVEVSGGPAPHGVMAYAVSNSGFKGKGAAVNQDCVAALLGSRGLVGLVVDGHGQHGHRCAERLIAVLPALLAEALQAVNVPAAIRSAFLAAEADLEAHASGEFDTFCSGASVACTIVDPRNGGKAYLASCGDCQAVLLDGTTSSFVQSVIHKAHHSQERARVEAAGGRIWVEDNDAGVSSRVFPAAGMFGLSMSRAFGDVCLKKHGVTAEPTVLGPLPVPEKALCILGSDGLFEVILPGEAAKVLHQLGSELESAPAAFVQEAQRRWLAGGEYCDDACCLLIAVNMEEAVES